MMKDPKSFLWNVGSPVGVIGFIIAFVLAFLPRDYLNPVYRLIRWPTPEELENEAGTHRGDVGQAVFRVLEEEYRVHESDIRYLG
jgi:hypothetical protein